MIEIDGSSGEGGGQVLRSSLAMSILTQKDFHIRQVRARRSKPGLMAQHLKSVQAAAAICQAKVEGDVLGSQELVFRPGPVKAGKYHFEIGTAGSTSLVLQTIFIPLSLAARSSQVTISGGTHVPHSPCFHYIDLQWMVYMRQIGFNAQLLMEQAGFYPPGGGRIQAVIRPAEPLSALNLLERGQLQRIHGISGVANLDLEIAKRQKHQALKRLEPRARETKIKTVELPSPVKGTFLLLIAEFEHSQCCYFALGEQGKRAERVADEAVDGLEAFLKSDGAIDFYLADQLLLPLSLVKGKSSLHTSKVTQHQLTNANVIRAFLPVNIQIVGELDQPGLVHIEPYRTC